jgi:hypothetical protein
MLSSKKVTAVLVFVLIILVMGSTLARQNHVPPGQNRQQRVLDQELIDRQQKKQAELEAQFPTVDYDAPEVGNDPDEVARRKEKNSRYDKRHFVSKDPNPGVSESAVILEGYSVPALPAEQSSLITVGEVLDSHAHLSNDKSGIYTELSIRIQEIIKNAAPSHLTAGRVITGERQGGIVRYQNAHRRLYHLAEEGMPSAGRKYVLFLGAVEHSKDYRVLTGYELSPNGVIPIDTSRQFKTYEGYDPDSFLNVVRAAIQ